MDIFRVDPEPTRPCLYFLGLQGGHVYADFDKDESGCLYLVRISYDTYGCCHATKDIAKLSEANSSELIRHIETNDLSAPAAAKIIRDYFHEIRDFIWEEALRDHGLI
jgi:hypothetical protein